jgi:hypothetical protein
MHPQVRNKTHARTRFHSGRVRVKPTGANLHPHPSDPKLTGHPKPEPKLPSLSNKMLALVSLRPQGLSMLASSSSMLLLVVVSNAEYAFAAHQNEIRLYKYPKKWLYFFIDPKNCKYSDDLNTCALSLSLLVNNVCPFAEWTISVYLTAYILVFFQ